MVIYNQEKILEMLDSAKKNRTETFNIEFKDGRGGGVSHQLWRTISSFAHNPDGGVIVFGIVEHDKDNSIEVVTIEDLSLAQEQISDYFANHMVNAPRPEIKLVPYEGETLIAVVVNGISNETKPCYYKNLGLHNGACVRVGNTDRVLSLDEVKQLLRDSIPFKFDKTRAIGTREDMLSASKVTAFLEKSAKKAGRDFINPYTRSALSNLGILARFDDGFSPTVGGFLIFSNEKPQSVTDFSRYIVKCVRYGGTTVSSPITDNLDVGGTLDEQIESIIKFILRNIPVSANIVQAKRVEDYDYPKEAIRELVANAVIHRDYTLTGTYTQVNIFSNRIEIYNPGNLPPGITIENIKDSQFSRNEIIAGVLKDMNYMEEYGRGINIVFDSMSAKGLMAPIFKNISNSFRVILLGKTFSDLNDRQVQIWNLIQDKGKITSKECVQHFEERFSRQTITNDLNKLIELNLVKQSGYSSGTYYEVVI